MERVVVLGSLSQDLHLDMERHPTTGETVMAGDIERRFGGKGANQAVAAALAGAETLIIGKVGDDQAGREYRTRLQQFGVDTAGLQVQPGAPTGTALIYVNAEHDNMIVVAPGANHLIDDDDLALLGELDETDILMLPNELQPKIIRAAVGRARTKGARVILNLAPYGAFANEVLQACDPVVVNETEHELLTTDGGAPRSLLVTLGTAGSRWGHRFAPAVQVPVLDTTGAGDAYCGTLAARLVRGDSPEQAMVAASSAAADCVQHLGAQPPLPR